MVSTVSGVFVPVEVLALEQGTTPEVIVHQIQSGKIAGRMGESGWHVLVQAPTSAVASPPPPPPPPEIRMPPDFEITNLQVPFWSLVVLLLKGIFAILFVVAGIAAVISGVETFFGVEKLLGMLGITLPF
jgi:hypothetical protein